MRYLIAAALIAGVVSTVAGAQSPRKPRPALDPAQRVCRSIESTGSRFTKSVCHTRAEWVQIDRADGDSASEEMRRPRGTMTLPQ